MGFRLFQWTWPLLSRSERARRAHEAWLNRAIRRPQAWAFRIPVRRVDEGGFRSLRATSAGRAWAEQWWDEAIAHADTIGG